MGQPVNIGISRITYLPTYIPNHSEVDPHCLREVVVFKKKKMGGDIKEIKDGVSLGLGKAVTLDQLVANNSKIKIAK